MPKKSFNKDKMRSWIFKCKGKGFYSLKEPVEIGGCKFEVIKKEKKANIYEVSTRIESKSMGQAEKIALERFNRFTKALSIAVGDRFEFELFEATEVTPQMPKEKKIGKVWQKFTVVGTIIRHFEPNMLDETRKIFTILKKSNKYSERALEYFNRGLLMRSVEYRSQEAYLNFFKVIELISDRFIPELKKKFKTKMEDLEDSEIKKIFSIYATRKRKIENVLEILDLNKRLKKDVGKLVSIRNDFDVAHASIEEIKLDVKDVDSCEAMAKQLIIGYLNSL